MVVGLVAAVVMAAAFVMSHKWMNSSPEVPGGPPTARLINSQQYINTIRDLFGEDIRVDAAIFALPERRQGLLSLGMADLDMTPGLFSQFERAARDVATQVLDVRRAETFVPCRPRVKNESDDACAGKFITEVGRVLYRRPLSETERTLYIKAARDATEILGDFYAGLADILAAMMVSPQFLYFVEQVEADPGHEGRYRLDAFSRATRLSLFLWNSLPDDLLLTAAEAGTLQEQAELERQVERMLSSTDRIERGVRGFFEDVLQHERFEALTKDPVIYPAFTSQAVVAAEEQALRLIVDHLLVRQADYRDLFTTSRTFVNSALAPLHRIPVVGDAWVPVTLDAKYSAGLLTSPAFLALHSHPGRSSPTLRGKAIREVLLCQKVPDPPANVDFTAFEASLETVKTARERLALHSTDPACSGCHRITDPIGLALENFDGAGQVLKNENGVAIDTSGDFDGEAFTDVAEFGQTLRAQPALAPCLVNRLYAYATGRQTTSADSPWLGHVVRHFVDDGYNYGELLRRIAMSRAFYAVIGPDERNAASAPVEN